MRQWWHIDTHRRYPVRETRYLRRYRKQGFRSAPPPVAKHWHKTKSGKYRLLSTRSKQSANIASYFVPGLGTYRALRAGHKLLFAHNLVGDVALAAWAYGTFTDSPSSMNSTETPGYVRRNWANQDSLMEEYYFG